MSETYRPIRKECKEEFDRIHRRIDKRDKMLGEQEDKLQAHGESLARMSEDVTHVTRSISALTKALWGVAGSLMASLFGFILWYVQSI